MRLSPIFLLVAFLALLIPPAPAHAGDLYKASPGPLTFKTIDEDWQDTARSRDVPVRIYLPAAAAGQKLPVIVFSHGLGGSRAGYSYFGEHMASHGYIVIMPTHVGSDTPSLLGRRGNAEATEPGARGKMAELLDDPANLRNRPLDISFVIDHLPKDAALRDVADTSRIGVAGHSFGAYTAMAIGGMTVDLPGAPKTSFRDPRVKAVLPMSPQGTGTMGIEPGAWDAFSAPVLFLTGTKDYGQGERAATWRRTPFDHIHTVDDYLAVLEGATHATFGNPAAPRVGAAALDAKTKARHAELVKSLSAAFFDAYVNDDAAAKAWLKKFFAFAHGDLTAEFKASKPAAAPSPPAK